MVQKILFLIVASVSMAAGEPTDARDMLFYPVNPLRRAGPSSSALTPEALQRQEAWREGQERWNEPVRRFITSPSAEAYKRADQKYKQGLRLAEGGEQEKAVDCLAESLSELIGLQRGDEDFQPMAVSYRMKKVLAELDGLLGEK